MSGSGELKTGKWRKEEEEESLTRDAETQRRGTQEKIWKVVAFDRKNHPFARGGRRVGQPQFIYRVMLDKKPKSTGPIRTARCNRNLCRKRGNNWRMDFGLAISETD